MERPVTRRPARISGLPPRHRDRRMEALLATQVIHGRQVRADAAARAQLGQLPQRVATTHGRKDPKVNRPTTLPARL